MEIQCEVSTVKYLILDDLGQTLKSILRECEYGSYLGNDSSVVQTLTHIIERILRHGLRDLHKGYWPIVQGVTHSATIQLINSLNSVHSFLGKGRAWLYFSLTEGSLESHLQCLSQDKQALRKHYLPHSLMRDESALEQLLLKIGKLQNVQFFLDPDVAYLEMSSYKQQGLIQSRTLSLTTSLTSSLASPVDSGVALLDSDYDATSVSEANCSFPDDDSSVTEMDAHKEDELSESSNTRIASPTFDTDLPHKHAIEKPILCEEILLKNDEVNNYNTRVRNPMELEEVLVNHAAAQLGHTVSMHNPGVCKAQVPNMCSIVDQLIDSNASMTASDIANQNIDALVSTAMTQSCAASFCTTLDTAKESNNAHTKNNKVNEGHTDCEEIVYRRQRKKNKNKAEIKVKRVSFHEDVLVAITTTDVQQETIPENLRSTSKDISAISASFYPAGAVIKKDAIKGRYSWCAEGYASYTSQSSDDTGTRSDVYRVSDHITLKQNPSKQYSNLNNDTHISYDLDSKGAETNQPLHMAPNRQLQGLVPSFNYSALETNLKYFPIEEQYAQGTFGDQECHMLQMDSLFQLASNSEPNCGASIAERGMPEGQEDPQKMCPIIHRHTMAAGNLSKFSSLASNLDCFSDSESAADFNVRRNLTKRNSLHGSSSKLFRPALDSKYGRMSTNEIKASLLNRFLKLVTVKKFVEKRTERKVLQRSLYIEGVKFDLKINKDFEDSLNEEIEKCRAELQRTNILNVDITLEFEDLLKSRVFLNNQEKLYKVFRIRGCYFVGGLSMPLLLVLTDAAVYITGVKENYTYCNHFVLPYSKLDTILVGPNGHVVELGSTDRTARFTFATGDSRTTQSLVGSIELAMRRAGQNRLPGIKWLNCEDMVAMRHSLVKQAAIIKEDPLLHYSLVFLQDNQSAAPCTPLGPTKEGHLMFRIATKGSVQSWTPGYFILKAGAVYMFEDQGHRLPKQVLMLRNGQCKGCQRLLNDRRPHTFQIILGWARAVQFAASDEYEASNWLQAFIQAAAGAYQEESVSTTACSLALTARRIVTCVERFPSGRAQVVSVANVADLTSYYACETWCVLEFACQEVNESSGDWILYFTSVHERQAFQENLQMLWQALNQQEEFPAKQTVEDYLATRCLETSKLLNQGWDHLLPLPPLTSL